MNSGIVIPFYNHERAIGQTVAALRPYGLPCWIVDDGSDHRCASVLDEIAQRESHWLKVLRYTPNRGKGHAVMTGLRAAADAGCTHGVQIDADGQHDPASLPHLLAEAQRYPEAVIAGVPIYDSSVPKSRLYGRYVTHIWVWIHTMSFQIRDSMCGFRVYPLMAALRQWNGQPRDWRMEFDTEILVRMFWDGVRVVNVPTRVIYPVGGVSHFNLRRDNLRITAMHTRLFLGMLWRLPRLFYRRALSA